jgi:hypothetical protein
MPDDYIKITDWVTNHAQKAYDTQFYIEAIQVLHGWIQNKLQELLILTGCIDHNSEMSKIWDMANEFDLYKLANTLYILSQINEHQFQMIIKFNKFRNTIIHNIYKDPYERVNPGIKKELYDEAFQIGIKLSEILQNKTEDKIQADEKN